MKLIKNTVRSAAVLLPVAIILSCSSNPQRRDGGINTGPVSMVHGTVQPKSSDQAVISKPSGGGYGVYGNWCGPNHPLEEQMDVAPGPVDRLDAACMIHDYCYAEKGYFDCACDENLTTELRRQLASHEYTTEQAIVARAIRDYFVASPCKQSEENPQAKTAATRSAYRVVNGIKRRVNKVWNWATSKNIDSNTARATSAK